VNDALLMDAPLMMPSAGADIASGRRFEVSTGIGKRRDSLPEPKIPIIVDSYSSTRNV